MGQMKAYAMWLEEQGYVEYVDTPDGGYVATDKHPGETEALNEYMESRDARRTG
jgi:hypothetical protein|tara:strand:- start:67 stop:228 length:162 start_codon:yes stop_codon:yes gene_type:complete